MCNLRRTLLLAGLLAAGSGLLVFAVQANAERLSAGFAHADVTPNVAGQKPVWIAGYGQNRRATGVHDPLYCRAVVLDDGRRKLALVSVDLVGLQYPSVVAIRAKLPEFDYVMVSSTHNHEGPDVIGIWGPSPLKTGVDPDYVALVEDRVAETVRRAAKATVPVRAAYGTAKNDRLLRDTRLPMVYDGVLRAVRLTGAKDGRNVGLLVQWSCHPESLGSRNQQITADFPFATIAALQERYSCPVVYFTGAVGGLMTTPSQITTADGKELREGNFEYAQQYGRAVAQLAGKAIDGAEPVALSPLGVSARPITIPLDNPLYAAARTIGVLKRPGRVWSGDSETLGQPAAAATPGDRLAIETEVAYLRLGQVHVACIPGEIYPELVYGRYQDPADPNCDYPSAPLEPPVMEILPGDKTLLLGMANDEVGYIIPKRQWDRSAPFAYGRNDPQYGEINSTGPDVAPIVIRALQNRVRGLPDEP